MKELAIHDATENSISIGCRPQVLGDADLADHSLGELREVATTVEDIDRLDADDPGRANLVDGPITW